MRHKKRTIHKNKYNKTRKNRVRNRSKQASRKYASPHRKTTKIRGGSDDPGDKKSILAKAYGAVQKGISSVGSVFSPSATEPEPEKRHLKAWSVLCHVRLASSEFIYVQ
jgi:hypothetical protein